MELDEHEIARSWEGCLDIVRRDPDMRLDQHIVPGDNLVHKLECPVSYYEINVMPREVLLLS